MQNVYICDGVRTAIGRYGGGLASVRADDLAAVPLKALLQRNPALDPSRIDDVIIGCANQAGEDNRNVARMALLLAGLPVEVPGVTVNRLCGSGMDAVAMAARAIATGEADLVMAGGVESMTRAPFVMAKPEKPFERTPALQDTTMGWRFVNKAMLAQFGADTMPTTAENVATRFGISREDQDAFAYRSQMRASKAMEVGRFAEEIVPVEIPGKSGTTVFVQDEHPRGDTKLEKLAVLSGVVTKDGTVTAGNASGINDGACALILASEGAVREHSLSPLARVVGSAVAGVEPRLMGIGPVPATNKLLQRLGLAVGDIDVIELNEAFAAQGLAVLRELGLPDDGAHVNPNGGAIALGHPLGMSGARLVLTSALELRRTGGRCALGTMCIGVGQGIAMVIERA